MALPLPLGADRERRRRIIERVKAHVHSRWKSTACPMCGATRWSIHVGHIVSVEFSEPESPGARFLPTVALVCHDCGNTVFVNMLVAGVDEADL